MSSLASEIKSLVLNKCYIETRLTTCILFQGIGNLEKGRKSSQFTDTNSQG